MARNNDLEIKVAELLEGKTIQKVKLCSYDGLLEIDEISFTDGSNIILGVPSKEGVNVKLV